jgi:tRNA modification GTPase
MPDSNVIAAIATPTGLGGIGVVRVSGEDLSALARAIVGRVPLARHATLTRFLDRDGQAIDQGIALYFPKPFSYTGEDVLELQGHGGSAVMRLLLERCLELGARVAEPGEFTRRAFLNDKLDLAQAESVADLIEASTAQAARCALRSLEGEFSSVVNQLVQDLVHLRTLVEATLDFPDEEVDFLNAADAEGQLARIREHLGQLLYASRQGSLLREGIHAVLVGRPNVGKSSLLNRLAGEDIAIVTEIPGTTRDTVRQAIQIDGVPLYLVDTAGLRESEDKLERMGMERTRAAIQRADLALVMVDRSEGETEDDMWILASLPPTLPVIKVHNKIDLSGDSPRVGRGTRGPEVWLSAMTQEGVELLRRQMLETAGWHPAGEGVYLARTRHLAALRAASERLELAVGGAQQLELFAEELRLAQDELASITGEFTSDALLGEIFSRFCIGK